MKEPNPNRYNSPQNYINALSEYWTKYGGPSNRNRAISMRLQIWFDKEHSKKKLLASNARNLRREFKEAAGAVAKFNNSNNNSGNSNSSMSHNAPSKGNMSAIQKIMKQLQKTNQKHSNASNKLRNISNKLVSNKNKMNHQKYSHVRNVMIPRTKANIRVQNSTRMFEQLRSKLRTKLPLNLVSRILSNNVVPSGLMKTGKKLVSSKTGKKAKNYWGTVTNLDIYKNKNGRFWFQDKHGRWYIMTSTNQKWFYTNMKMGWFPIWD